MTTFVGKEGKAAAKPDLNKRPNPRVIEFYLADEQPYGVFSNLSPHPVIDYDGTLWPTVEHGYQAGKIRDAKVRAWLLSAPTPGLLAHTAQNVFAPGSKHFKQYGNPEWDSVKIDRMLNLLQRKFAQHTNLRTLLLGTGDAELVEAGFIDNPSGRFWGRVNGKGENWLGRLLMEVRDELREGDG